MVAAPKLPIRMDLADFLAWSPQDGLIWQLIDGEPVAMAPPSRTHGAIQSEISGLLRDHLLAKGSPCFVVTTPGIVPRVQSEHNIRIPDLAVTCSPGEANDSLLRDPLLAIEILSPSNEAETWSNVWTYTTIPSLREILVVDSTRIRAELLRRDEDGNWPERPALIEAGEIALPSIGFTSPLHAFYRTTRLGGG